MTVLADRVRAMILPILALTIAVTQVVCATAGPLSPWKGGGFGMFASSDNPAARMLIVSVTDDAGDQHLVRLDRQRHQGPLSERERGRLRTFPTKSRMRALAVAIRNSTLVKVRRDEVQPPSEATKSQVAIAPDIVVTRQITANQERPIRVTRVDVAVLSRFLDRSRHQVRIGPVAGFTLTGESQ